MCVRVRVCVYIHAKQQQQQTNNNSEKQNKTENNHHLRMLFALCKKKPKQSFLECHTETGRCIPGFVKTHFDEGFILPYKTRCDCVLARKKFPRTAPADCLGPEKGRQRRLPAMFFFFFFHNRDHALSDLDIASARSVCSNALQSYSSHEVACVSFYRHVFGVRLDYP